MIRVNDVSLTSNAVHFGWDAISLFGVALRERYSDPIQTYFEHCNYESPQYWKHNGSAYFDLKPKESCLFLYFILYGRCLWKHLQLLRAYTFYFTFFPYSQSDEVSLYTPESWYAHWKQAEACNVSFIFCVWKSCLRRNLWGFISIFRVTVSHQRILQYTQNCIRVCATKKKMICLHAVQRLEVSTGSCHW